MGQWRASVDVPADRYGPRAARQVVVALLDVWDLRELAADAELVVSELVTNAYRHAPGTDRFELEVIGRADGVWISLVDGSPTRPVVHELSRDRVTGRGMALVAALADRWGADDLAGGKRIWADLVAQRQAR
jgi:anti-sigma regulatory factor (Ser/Thr protein kinase)